MYKYLFSFLLIVFLTQPSQIFADEHEELVSGVINAISIDCLLYTSDAADE